MQELPLEYNTWLLFRQAVDIILLKCVSSPFLWYVSKTLHVYQRFCGVLHVCVLLLPNPGRTFWNSARPQVCYYLTSYIMSKLIQLMTGGLEGFCS